jgi:predicted ATPase
LSGQRPLVVAIDDLQWADPSSLLVLYHLGRSVHRLPVLLVGACRRSPPPDLERLLARRILGVGSRWLP